MLDILIATGNPGKLGEYRVLLAGAPVNLLSPADVGLDSLEVKETGETFLANAELKAVAYAKASGHFALADDSGLCVDALNGAPGLYSARYGGPGLDDAGRRKKLLSEMADVPDEQRTAYFDCVVALADPNTLKCTYGNGICRGRIVRAGRGNSGFGYDPIFQPEGHNVTFAELPEDTKNRISHRGRATQQLLPILTQIARSP